MAIYKPSAESKLEEIKSLISRFGYMQDKDVKQYMLDQILQIVCEDGDDYKEVVDSIEDSGDGPCRYEWGRGEDPT